MSTLPFLLRLAARAGTVFLAGLYFLILAGELSSRPSGAQAEFRDWAGILLLTTCIVGMVVAWRHELAGALLSLATLIVFALVVQFHNYALIAVVALPGLCYLADWMVRHRETGHHA
ncbi:MAG: hypothetical protein HY820_24260 [Acidobacteria bacterium]|nr:hypothetical protein [Acidobacteriota bacterium]